jgi:uncharacterized protein (TIGR02246 family)
MVSRRFRYVAVLALLAGACAQPAPPPPPPGPDLAAEERAIREADARWLKASQAKDAAAEAALLASDAVVFREHVDPLVGPAAYQAFEEKTFKENPKIGGGWTTDTITVAKSGEIAVQTGTFNITGLGPKGDGKDTGKFVTIWKKVGGAWKVANDIGSTTMPEPHKH